MSDANATATYAQGIAQHTDALNDTLSSLAPSGPEHRIRQNVKQAVKLYASAQDRPSDASVLAGLEANDTTRTAEYRQEKATAIYQEIEAQASDEIAQADALLDEATALVAENALPDPKLSEGRILDTKSDLRSALDRATDGPEILQRVRELALAAKAAGDVTVAHVLASPAMVSYWVARGVSPADVRAAVVDVAGDARLHGLVGGGRDAQAIRALTLASTTEAFASGRTAVLGRIR